MTFAFFCGFSFRADRGLRCFFFPLFFFSASFFLAIHVTLFFFLPSLTFVVCFFVFSGPVSHSVLFFFTWMVSSRHHSRSVSDPILFSFYPDSLPRFQPAPKKFTFCPAPSKSSLPCSVLKYSLFKSPPFFLLLVNALDSGWLPLPRDRRLLFFLWDSFGFPFPRRAKRRFETEAVFPYKSGA